MNIRKSVEKWLKSISMPNNDPYWFHSYNTTPFDNSNFPHINININHYFSHRRRFQKMKYEIFSHSKLLDQGIMLNGKIYTNVTVKHLPDWEGSIKIIVKPHRSILTTAASSINHQFVIQGRLKQSKLDGTVIIHGTLPNDPDDDCEEHFTNELGLACLSSDFRPLPHDPAYFSFKINFALCFKQLRLIMARLGRVI